MLCLVKTATLNIDILVNVIISSETDFDLVMWKVKSVKQETMNKAFAITF